MRLPPKMDGEILKNVSELSVTPLLEGIFFDCFFVFFSKGIPSEIIAVKSFPIGSWNMMDFFFTMTHRIHVWYISLHLP